MNKIPLFKILLVLSIFLFLFSTPSFADISLKERYWTETCSINPDTIDLPMPQCEEKGIEQYLSITWEEQTPKKWKFTIKPTDEFWEHYKESDLKKIPIMNISKKLKMGEVKYDKNDKLLEVEIEFEDEWKVGKKFKIGHKSTIFTSSTNIVQIVGDATCGNSASNPCDYEDIYSADKAGELELLENKTSPPSGRMWVINETTKGDWVNWHGLDGYSLFVWNADLSDNESLPTNASGDVIVDNITKYGDPFQYFIDSSLAWALEPPTGSINSDRALGIYYGTASATRVVVYFNGTWEGNISVYLARNTNSEKQGVNLVDKYGTISCDYYETHPYWEGNWITFFGLNATDGDTINITIDKITAYTMISAITFASKEKQDRFVLDNDVSPADNNALKLNISVTGFASSGYVNITGTDIDDNAVTDNVSITGNGNVITSTRFKDVDYIRPTGSFGFSINQSRWGIMWKEGSSYIVDAKLKIGDGTTTTYFNDSEKTVTFKSGVVYASGEYWQYVSDNAYFTIGILEDATEKIGSKGVTFVFEEDKLANCYMIQSHSGGYVAIYGSTFDALHYRQYLRDLPSYTPIYNTMFIHLASTWYSSIDNRYVTYLESDSAFPNLIEAILDNVYVFGGQVYGIFYYPPDNLVVRNLIARNFVYLTYRPQTLYLINPDLDTWTNVIGYSLTTSKVFRQYEFDLNVTDESGNAIDGATINLNSSSIHDSTNCFNNRTTTSAGGGIDTQTITTGYYNQTGGDTMYDCNPYIITITKPTYETYNATISLNEKTEYIIALKDTLGSGSCDKSIYLSGSTVIVNDTDVTFQDIYNCDDYNAWGCIDTEDLSSYSLTCHLDIGDGTNPASLFSELETIVFDGDYGFEIQANANFTLGDLETGSSPVNGSTVIWDSPTGLVTKNHYGTLNAYSTTFLERGTPIRNGWVVHYWQDSSEVNFDRVTTNNIRYMLILKDGSTSTIKDLYCVDNYVCINAQTSAITIEDLRGSYNYCLFNPTNFDDSEIIVSGLDDDGTNTFSVSWYTASRNNLTLLNSKLSSPINWYTFNSKNNTINMDYEFDLKVINSTGNSLQDADVNITDKDDVNVISETTNSSGQIPTQNLTSGHYNTTGGATFYVHYPHVFTITKPTYTTYNTSTTFDEKTDLTITLDRTLGSGSCSYTSSYNSTSNVVSIQGGTSASPIDFQDLFNCDDFYDWGCIETDDLITYTLHCYVNISGNGATRTFFNASDVAIVWDDDVMGSALSYKNWAGDNYGFLTLTNNATLTLGKVKSSSLKTVQNPVSVLIKDQGTSDYINGLYVQGSGYEFNFYGVTWRSNADIDRSYIRYGNLWHSKWIGGFLALYPTEMDIYEFYLVNGFEGLASPVDCNLSNIFITSSPLRYVISSGKSIDLRDSTLRSVTKQLDSRWSNSYFTNVDDDNWATLTWYLTSSGITKRRITLDLLITNETNDVINGANVTMWNSNKSTKIFSVLTNSSGVIPTQTIETHWITYANGTTWNNYGPFLLTITKPTYQTYNTTMTLDGKSDLTIALKRTLGSGSCDIPNITFTPASDNLLTVWGTTFGGNNITWTDLYDCDDYNAWGCIDTEDLTSFTVTNCRIQIGDGSTVTWFKDTNKMITLDWDGTDNWEEVFIVEALTNFQYGDVIDSTQKTVNNGMVQDADLAKPTKQYTFVSHATSNVSIYDSYFKDAGMVIFGNVVKVWGTIIETNSFSNTPATSDVYRVTLVETPMFRNQGNWNDVFQYETYIAIEYRYADSSVLKNVKFRNFTTLFKGYSFTGDVELINPDLIDAVTTVWTNTNTGKLWEKYELNLKTIDNTSAGISREIVGAVVNINTTSTDAECNTNFRETTDSNGEIAQQTVLMGYYNQTGGDTIYDCNPYRFIIEKSGYQDLNFTANITEKTDWTLSLTQGITELTLIKNIEYSNQNSTHVNYTITDQVINTGTLNVTDIVFQDSDISASFTISNLGVNETNTTTGIVTVTKAMNNYEKTFVAATATVDTLIYYSNQPSVLIPGTGGPADVSVSVPSSVTTGATVSGNITITNMNPDIGQDFTIDYMITNVAETTNYSTGQKTIYVGASSTNSTLGPLTAPSQAGTYKYKTIVSWIGGSASASASFTVTAPAAPSGPTGAARGLILKGKLNITEYPSEIVVEQGGVEFYSLTIKNIGDGTLNNIEINLEGISSEWYSTIPEDLEELDAGKSQVFILKIKLPSTAQIGTTPVTIKAICDEDSTEVSSKLVIKPMPVELIRIYDIQITTLDKLYQNEEGKITIFVENAGNKNITVTASLFLPEGISGDEKVTKIIEPETNAILEFDVLPTVIGVYNATLIIKYDGKEISKNILLSIEEIKPVVVTVPWEFIITVASVFAVANVLFYFRKKIILKIKKKRKKRVRKRKKPRKKKKKRRKRKSRKKKRGRRKRRRR